MRGCKPHGLWFPVDVSTSAQATIGGMAGNNSCGSRSIGYGNMVHNVLAIDALTRRRRPLALRPDAPKLRAAGRYRSWSRKLQALYGAKQRDRGALSEGPAQGRRLQPRHARGCRTHNMAHLLVGSEGTLAYFASAAPQARAAAARARARRVPFPDLLHARWTRRSTSSSSGPTAVELVDRTMIELAREHPGVPPDRRALRQGRSGRDPAGRVRRRRCRRRRSRRLKQLVELMGDLGLPGSVVEIDRRAPAEARCGRCARPASTS